LPEEILPRFVQNISFYKTPEAVTQVERTLSSARSSSVIDAIIERYYRITEVSSMIRQYYHRVILLLFEFGKRSKKRRLEISLQFNLVETISNHHLLTENGLRKVRWKKLTVL
jgi:hypothetical protein